MAVKPHILKHFYSANDFAVLRLNPKSPLVWRGICFALLVCLA